MRCLSVRPSVTFVDHGKTNKRIFEIFSPSGSHTILVILHTDRGIYALIIYVKVFIKYYHFGHAHRPIRNLTWVVSLCGRLFSRFPFHTLCFIT